MSIEKQKCVITMSMNRCDIPHDLMEIVLANFDMAIKEAHEQGRQELKASFINNLQHLCQTIQ